MAFWYVLALTMLLPLPVPAQSKTLDTHKIAGAYHYNFENGDVQGETFQSTNTLEIVELGPETVYFHTTLEFFNNHVCELSGIAEINGSDLVYRHMSLDDKQCTFHIRFSDELISFDDIESCARDYTCGARGGYIGTEFPVKSRTMIERLDDVLASDSYKKAVANYNAAKTPH